MQPQKHVVHVEAHAPMEQLEPEVLIESQIPDEALDQVGHPPTQEKMFLLERIQLKKQEVPELLQLPIVPPQPKPMV